MQSPYQDTAAALPPGAAATPDMHRKVRWQQLPESRLKQGPMRYAIGRDVARVPVKIL